MLILIEAVCSFFACLFFAIIYNTPKKELVYVGLAGAVGYAIFFTLDRYAHLNAAGLFLASSTICIMAKYFSVSHTMPKLLYVLPAIYPLVPGAGIYYAMHDIMIGDFASAINEGMLALKTVGIVVLAMILILPDQFFKFTKLAQKRAAVLEEEENAANAAADAQK
ncbi:MAG: threonine/serine exporter family protein [Firmicutes bacterium]|nr:threonine/serine exporter family protein [Bacillota bacterium]